jgi:tetratricopeptide (TPR) repeat protein
MKDPLSTAKFLIDIDQKEKAKIVLDLMQPYAQLIEHFDELGQLYVKCKSFDRSLEIALKLYNDFSLTPDQKYTTRINIIRGYLQLNKPEEALKFIQINLKDAPDDPNLRMEEAFTYFLLDRKDLGEKVLRDILTKPHDQEIDRKVKFNLGTYDLRNGLFKKGLREVLLGGRAFNSWHEFPFPKTNLWQGEPAEGKTILVCAEGGIGDEIISVRFMKHLKEKGLNPIWFSNSKAVINIFERCGFPCMSNVKLLPDDWLWTYSMPVPSYLELEQNELWYGPYLSPIKKAPKLEGEKKIGIKSMGNPQYDQDLHRTVPFEEMIACIPEDYTIYSFHMDEDLIHPRVINLKDKIKNWDDTFDYIDQMDIVVSSCTSLIHAAGSMGKLSVVLTPLLNYYTWAIPGNKTKWYSDNLTIFRQKHYANWDLPLAELKEYLHENIL